MVDPILVVSVTRRRQGQQRSVTRRRQGQEQEQMYVGSIPIIAMVNTTFGEFVKVNCTLLMRFLNIIRLKMALNQDACKNLHSGPQKA
ncbi:MAG: hypothetical protein SAK29_39815 [Scytonema sp. PMC 1069.18]|nr:hypothetical protein [Scytonema sp. PMC 1069.18]MEC4887097.1 hypothetical protein [Scytonema sp. PMC 1070.18]